MIYFLAPYTGALFLRINRPNRKPKLLIRYLKRYMDTGFVLFKCGMNYDFGLHRHRETRKWGKARYKELSGFDLPEETILKKVK